MAKPASIWSVSYENYGNGHYEEWLVVGPARVPAAGTRKLSGDDWSNARLIAAAPELLEACRSAVEALGAITHGEAEHNPAANHAESILRAAIAEAEGTED